MRLKKKVKLLGVLLILLIVFISLSNNNDNSTKAVNKIVPKINHKKEYNLNMLMVGDTLIHGSVYQAALKSANVYDFKPMFTYINPIATTYDLAFYNQESIIGGKDLGLSSYPRFNSPEEIGDAMVGMGFNLVSLANNHTLDKGEKGIVNSLNYWKNKQAMTAGSYISLEDKNKINVNQINNITYSLLSYTTLTNGLPVPYGKEFLVDVYDKDKVKSDVEKIRSKVDVLIVSMHWGTEYTNTPTEQQEEIATYLSSLGVDIIIGHHPHVIQPIKYIGKTLVVYSLGNFISAQIGINKLIGLMVMLDINKTVENGKIEININNINTELLYTYRTSGTYKVIPFSKLNNNMLPNYQDYFDSYSKIIQNYDKTIKINAIQ